MVMTYDCDYDRLCGATMTVKLVSYTSFWEGNMDALMPFSCSMGQLPIQISNVPFLSYYIYHPSSSHCFKYKP